MGQPPEWFWTLLGQPAVERFCRQRDAASFVAMPVEARDVFVGKLGERSQDRLFVVASKVGQLGSGDAAEEAWNLRLNLTAELQKRLRQLEDEQLRQAFACAFADADLVVPSLELARDARFWEGGGDVAGFRWLGREVQAKLVQAVRTTPRCIALRQLTADESGRILRARTWLSPSDMSDLNKELAIHAWLHQADDLHSFNTGAVLTLNGVEIRIFDSLFARHPVARPVLNKEAVARVTRFLARARGECPEMFHFERGEFEVLVAEPAAELLLPEVAETSVEAETRAVAGLTAPFDFFIDLASSDAESAAELELDASSVAELRQTREGMATRVRELFAAARE